MSSTPASGGATSRGAALPPPVPVVPIGPAASHRVLFRAWADAADLEPLAVPRIGDRRRPEPPWQFLRPFTGSASIDPSEIRSPREDGQERLSLHLTVLMGITDTRALLDSINHRLDADPDRERSTIPAGNCFSCSVEVDMATSLPRPDSMVQSRLVLLARRLATPGHDLRRALGALQRDVERERTWLSIELEDEPAPDDIWDRLTSRWASTSSVDARPRGFTTAKVYGQWVRDGEDPEVAGLESFFSADLRRLAEVEPNRTLRRYLAGVPRRAPADAVDIRNPSEQALALPVGSGPAGRWPARTGTLTTSQRIAVRHMDDRLDEPGHIVAVNGPPGTGKSTLLRELVAQQIVERAGVIADLGPNRAFPVDHTHGPPVFRVHPDVQGREIVVASSNNAAVNNVAEVLNDHGAVRSGLAPCHLTAAGRSGDLWALMCLTLGRRDNVRRAAELVAPSQRAGPTESWIEWFAAAALPPWPEALAAFRDAQDRVRTLSAAAERRAAERVRLGAIAAWFEAQAGADPRRWGSYAQDQADRCAVDLDVLQQRRPRWLAEALHTASWRRWSAAHEVVDDERRRFVQMRAEAQAWIEASANPTLSVEHWRALGEGDRERFPPGVDAAVESARVDVFEAALRLHGAALAARPWVVASTLRAWAKAVVSPDGSTQAARVALWRSLFTVVPVVTTTFASAGRLLRDFGEDALGVAVIDEAGQASGLQAVPLLSKVRRAVIVGDPQQLQPIVTLEPELLRAVMEAGGADARWSPDQASVQHLADAGSQFGTGITVGEETTWVGLPLRAHFRCADPMFSVSNAISYGDQMIQMRPAAARPLPDLGGRASVWIDVPLAPGHRHWGQHDAACLGRLLGELEAPPADLFVVAPFRDAVDGARSVVDGRGTAWRTWSITNIGTIHTVQGREAGTVILLLSAASARPGARAWASMTPNLVNVAATRARERLIVVGNHDAWSPLPHVGLLAAHLPVEQAPENC